MSKRTQLYTTAPETYDGFGTKTVKIVGRIKDRDVRLVETPQEHATWQLMRYHSGAVYMVADEREWQEILRYKLAEPLEGVSHYEGMSLKALKRERILDEIDAWESGAKATIGQPATGEN